MNWLNLLGDLKYFNSKLFAFKLVKNVHVE